MTNAFLQSAFALDRRGREKEAIPLYLKAIGAKLDKSQMCDALVCLGSSYRNIGRLAAAERTLRRAARLFPQDPLPKMFLALTLHDRGKTAAAVRILSLLYLSESSDPGVAAFKRTLQRKFTALAQGAKRR